MQKTSLERTYFDTMYENSPDPWSFATSEYEAEKYATTISLLEQRHFARGFEIGCSIGVLSNLLAPFCDQLISVDTSQKALDQAKRRNAQYDNVHFSMADVPNEFPDDPFDLIVISEVAYYWDAQDDARARDLIVKRLTRDGLLVLVHFLPFVDDYPRTGDAVHEAFLHDSRFIHKTGLRRERYRADTFTCR
jgi:SAM-dependent methyltransferase